MPAFVRTTLTRRMSSAHLCSAISRSRSRRSVWPRAKQAITRMSVNSLKVGGLPEIRLGNARMAVLGRPETRWLQRGIVERGQAPRGHAHRCRVTLHEVLYFIALAVISRRPNSTAELKCVVDSAVSLIAADL